ncbi:hypothetical protein HHL16_00085 [Pseudoflavitalea sp. G-6-1-2]|uniref:hypothetical protein n=1 Tax=Pseudoflavitalea sp. G-6-1-2 TaxID=2728841 RepID=UPI00146B592A|nr:hypothetical protein [Pseudoflavitalea sp. G-6-1-2]NML19242.1 hypothetical protein [Pseudoflavitalea sp. G-6-1-2]
MKKLILALLLTFTLSAGFSQVYGPASGTTIYANGDSYGFWMNEIPGAVSYEWYTLGNTGATIWPGWDTAIDITFSRPGMCDVICKVTMENGTVVEYGIQVDVYEE